MTPSLALTQSDVQVALRSFLLSALPSGMVVIEGQDNRVPEPTSGDFAVFTAIRRERIETNVDDYIDTAFTGSIATTVLTVSAMRFGSIAVGNQVFGVGIPAGTTIASFGTGTGGVGTYNLNNSMTVASEGMAAGIAAITQPTKITFQVDVHGPNSANNAQSISTLMRDDFAIQSFLASGFDVTPLYADDPKQIPFMNAEGQWETRWIVEAVLQANEIISGIPQQFAAQLAVALTNINAAYSP